MRYPEPILTTESIGDGVRVTARYETPETARMMLSAHRLVHATATLIVAMLGHQAIGVWAHTVTEGQRLVAEISGLALAFGIGLLAADALLDRRFGVRGLTDHRLALTFHRDVLTIGERTVSRTGRVAFTSEPHRGGRSEARAEQVSGETIPEIYRRAHVVTLQIGEAFVLLAAVSDDQSANAIARRLQVIDEGVTRGGSADGSAVTFGHRHTPE